MARGSDGPQSVNAHCCGAPPLGIYFFGRPSPFSRLVVCGPSSRRRPSGATTDVTVYLELIQDIVLLYPLMVRLRKSPSRGPGTSPKSNDRQTRSHHVTSIGYHIDVI